MAHYDVAIVGLGPTGATLANLLGQCGVKVLVVERESAAYHLPRAVHFDAEVMRVFQWIGIADQMEPLTAGHPGMRFVDKEGKLLLDWPRPQGVGPQGWRSNYRFHQPDLEKLLRCRLTDCSNVTIRTSCEMLNLENAADRVELQFEDLTNNQREYATASYVVGCDGARSLVRRAIESGMEDYGFNERWLVVDVVLHEEKPELGDYSIQYCASERPATYVRGPGKRRRWEFTVKSDEDSDDIVRPERVWALLSEWLMPDEAILERSAVYVFHSLVAAQWRRGRFILAGDSCHQTPPFMGQGMCAGIRDAANLYWKLALVCQGKLATSQAEQLLASYETERKPNAREYIQTAIRLGGLINNCGTDVALRAALPGAGGSALMESIAPPIGPGLGVGKGAGRLFGQPRLIDRRLMDEEYRHHWVIIAEMGFANRLELPPDVALITTETSPNAIEHLARFSARAVVLRPDRYTLGTADTVEQLATLLASILPSPIGALIDLKESDGALQL